MRRYGVPLSIGAMLLLLVAVTIWFAAPAESVDIPLSVRSNAPDGGRALMLWLGEMGFQTRELSQLPYAVDREARLLFVLDPRFPAFTQEETDALVAWVQAGGTLVLASDALIPRGLFDALEVDTVYANGEISEAVPAQPLLLDPAVRRVQMASDTRLIDASSGLVPLLYAPDGVMAAERPLGQGWVVVLSSPLPFTNDALAQADNAALVLNLVRRTPPGSVVLFDEVHHGLGEQPTSDLMSLMLRTSLGRGILLALAFLFLFLALRGQRFGRPRPLPQPIGRSVGEYVSAMAALYRRAGQRAFIAEHFDRHLRRQAARTLGLQPTASEQELADRFRARGHDPEVLLGTLGQLRRPHLSEQEVLRLVNRAESQLDAVGARGPLGSRREGDSRET